MQRHWIGPVGSSSLLGPLVAPVVGGGGRRIINEIILTPQEGLGLDWNAVLGCG